MNDSHLVLVIHLFDGAHRRVKANLVVDTKFLAFRNADPRTIVPV